MSNVGAAVPIPTPELAPAFSLPFSGAPSPWAQSGLWDTLFISGVPWQGRIKIRGAQRTYQWDTKHSAGVQGYVTTYRGQPHKNFWIDFFIWTDSMWAYWSTTYQLLFQLNGVAGVVLPVKVYHPSLTAIGITAIVADSIGAAEVVSDDMLLKVPVEVHEFYPPIPVNATATPAAAAGVNPNIPGIPPPSAAALAAAQQAAQARQAAAVATALP
jgi:hypothetical protein